MPNAVRTYDLSRSFDELVAVDRLNLEVEEGEMFGLVGPDGAGKTTVIRMLCGILAPGGGTASVLGHDIARESDLVKKEIGYLSQRFTLYGDLTVDENIEFFAEINRVYDFRARREELLEFTRLTPFRGRLAEKLSGGMKQKLALACTLVHSPRLIFLDEPTTGVDPVSRRDFWRILQSLIKEGITIVMTTPYLDEAERCTRVALLNRGSLMRVDTPEGMKSAMVGEILEIVCDGVRDASALLRSTEGGAAVQAFGDRVHVIVPDASSGEARVRSVLAQGGIRVAGIRRVEPSLENVFIALLDTHGIPGGGAMSGSAIEVSHLSKKFGTFTAVDDVSFDVAEGEIFGFLGANGAGKSTTIRMLCGLLPPSGGTALVAGCDLRTQSEAVKLHIGYMSQRFSLYDDLTVEQNIRFYGGIYGLKGEKLGQRMAWVLSMADLRGREGSLTRTLSGGWKQRLALGCAILHEPRIVFLDEPTGGVDPISRRNFWELINSLSAAGITVLVTTHFLDEAEYCNHIILINAGKLIASGSPSELKARHITRPILEVRVAGGKIVEALETVRTLPWALETSVFGTSLHVMVADEAEGKLLVTQVLASSGIPVRRIERIVPSLEDVFLYLLDRQGAGKASA